jgi:hypothetical protein
MVSVHAPGFYNIYCSFLVDEIIELKILACSFEITVLTKFENPFLQKPFSKTLKL